MQGIDTETYLIAWGVGCVVGAVVGYAIGKARGRAGLGLTLGLLLGVIGWIISALLPRPSGQITRAQRPSRGWFPDPTGRHELRYFDGREWVAEVADAGVMGSDPITVAPVADPAVH